MSKLIVMVGLPGSGKSYKAKELSDLYNAQIFSSDLYRKIMFGDENDQTHNEEIFKKLYSELNIWLAVGKNCILDATNVTLKARKKIFDNLTKENREKTHFIAYVMNTPIKECIKRDKKRERSVGVDVINKFYQSYQHPQKFEGFDDIIINEFGPFLIDGREHFFFDSMTNFNQENPHHIYALDEHCKRLSMCYTPNTDDLKQVNNTDLIKHIAGLFHDVGKLYTQKFDEKGVAHYYNHDNVGTYELVSKLWCWYPNYNGFIDLDGLNEILFYVNYHMRAHKDFLNPKAEKKYRSLFGDERFDSLLEFAENDKIASGTYEVHDEILEEEKTKRT